MGDRLEEEQRSLKSRQIKTLNNSWRHQMVTCYTVTALGWQDWGMFSTYSLLPKTGEWILIFKHLKKLNYSWKLVCYNKDMTTKCTVVSWNGSWHQKKKRVLLEKNLNKAYSSVIINLFSFGRYRSLHKHLLISDSFSCLRDRHLISIVLNQQH